MKRIKDNFFKKFSSSTVTVENLCERVHWLVFLRWLAGIGVIISVLAGKAFFFIDSITIPLLLGVAILGYNGLFEFARRKMNRINEATSPRAIQRRIIFINFQIIVDLLVLATLIHYTGGIANPFLFFFIFHMVISSIMLSRRNAYLLAVFTIVLQTTLFYLEHTGVIPSRAFFPFYPQGLVKNGMYVLQILMGFSVTILITVYFATSIVKTIRKRQLELADLKSDLQAQRDQFERMNDELRQLDHSKTEFLYRVEHELKAPIGALKSLLSVVIRGYASVDEEKKKELLGRAANRVTMMKELVVDLLSLSRVNERSFELEREPLDLADTIKEVVEDLVSYAEKKGIGINCDLAPLLPKISADKHSMNEILHNLIHNGVKYSFEGEVKVSLHQEDQWLVFKVKDNGIGISEEDLENIFTEFYRTSNAKAFEEGTGLGLSLVKRLIEKHGGSIEVSSQLDQGTEFIVRFPVQ